MNSFLLFFQTLKKGSVLIPFCLLYIHKVYIGLKWSWIRQHFGYRRPESLVYIVTYDCKYRCKRLLPFFVVVVPPSLNETMSVHSFSVSPSQGCLSVGVSDRHVDIHKDHYQQVEKCAHNTHNAKHVFKVHFVFIRFRKHADSFIQLQKTECVHYLQDSHQLQRPFNSFSVYWHVSASRGRHRQRDLTTTKKQTVCVFAWTDCHFRQTPLTLTHLTSKIISVMLSKTILNCRN